MRVKAADIAKKLNISKATVSLALNNKPGVSQETRDRVLQCMNELKTGEESSDGFELYPAAQKIIKIIMMDAGIHMGINMELDLWSDTYAQIKQEVKKLGYRCEMSSVGEDAREMAQVVAESNMPAVAGVILFATEMQQQQFEHFSEIQKPMIIYDNDLSKDHTCVVIDGVTAVKDCVDYLVLHGHKEIQYLANSENIYNFMQRRAGFRAGLRKYMMELKEDSFLYLGSTIDEIYQNMKQYLESGKQLPDAFVMENYQVSIGVMRALREKNIKIPEELSLMGIDELPSYLTGDFLLTTVRISHEERARILVMCLDKEIRGELKRKYKILSNCEIVSGNSVADQTETLS